MPQTLHLLKDVCVPAFQTSKVRPQPSDLVGIEGESGCRMLSKTEQPRPESRSRWSTIATFLPVAISVAVACAALSGAGSVDPQTFHFTTEKVGCERFIKTVRISGDVRTFQPAIVFNNCRYRSLRILELVPEGSSVNQGDIICILDSSELQDRLNEQKIRLIRAEAGLATAEVQDSIQRIQNDRRLSNTNSRLTLAQQTLTTFEQAESMMTLEQLGDEVAIKKDMLETAREKHAQTEYLTSLGYNNLAQLDLARTQLHTAQAAFDRAEGALTLKQDFQNPRDLMDLQSAADIARLDAHRAQLLNDRGLAGTKLTKLEMQQKIATIQNYVDDLSRSIKACTIIAPKSGEVIYCHQSDTRKMIAVGGLVYYAQDIIRIADRSRMVLSGRVQDTRVYDLSIGQSASVDVANVTSHEYKATLTWIAPVSSRASRYSPGDRYHDVQIELEGEPESLDLIALGATADAEVIVDDRDHVMQIPTKAVFSQPDGYAVIVKNATGPERRVIELGNSNDVQVEVLSGLSPGEDVVIDSPHVLRNLADTL